ncbi:hypothetical protein [Janibacter melonis]|uniref:hypothetical protein n=1 Tax=Janibacter melonis TaxID=262209 RepID=UPI001748BFF3|nr:hypothetical protein [Janibacter melonis]
MACPWCIERRRNGRPVLDKHGQELHRVHRHGIGPAGTRPVLGDRGAHCKGAVGGMRDGYVITDPFGLVPERIGQPKVTS